MLKLIQTRLTSGLLEPEVVVAKNYAENPLSAQVSLFS